MRKIVQESELSKNLGVSGYSVHSKMLNDAVNMTGETKSKLVQTLIEKYLKIEIDLIRKQKNENYFKRCLHQRSRTE